MKFGKLFEPVRIGSMELKNRLIVPAMGTNLANPDGTASEALIEYYTERARGGFGLIITECTAVTKEGSSLLNECGMWNDAQSESFKALTQKVHEAGGKICMQLVHHGREGSANYNGGARVIGPSQVPCPLMQEVPRALTTAEVYEEIEKYVDASERVKKAGFDAVELHVASGYLIEQFLSLHSNKRTDEFGGSLHNRMRFLLLIIRGMRRRLGNDYPVMIRLCVDEFMTGGYGIEEAKVICREAEEAGVNAIDVTVGTYRSIENVIGSAYMKPGYQMQYSKMIKEVVSIPVIGVGRLSDPYMANEAILSKAMDIVAIGRQSMADPHYPNKVYAGDLEDICPCISCNQGCIHQLFADQHISCVANPFNGFESTKKIMPAEEPKKVMVIGGGPAGMEAAWISAKRGHDVTIYEKSDHLGGAFLVAAYPPGKSEITKMLAYYEYQCKKNHVKVVFHVEVDESVIKKEAPDAIILATGSKPMMPPVKGIDNPAFRKANDVIMSNVTPGHKVLVAGGGLIGAETADFLAEQMRDVTVIEMKTQIAADVPAHTRPVLMKLLEEKHVNMVAGAVIQEFYDDGVVYKQGGEIKELRGFDDVVLAMGTVSHNPLEAAAKSYCENVYVIGDAKKAGNVYTATHEAMDTALMI